MHVDTVHGSVNVDTWPLYLATSTLVYVYDQLLVGVNNTEESGPRTFFDSAANDIAVLTQWCQRQH
jgi:hypothetical protein